MGLGGIASITRRIWIGNEEHDSHTARRVANTPRAPSHSIEKRRRWKPSTDTAEREAQDRLTSLSASAEILGSGSKGAKSQG
eukprot:6771885-Pyramimonas_sp.AAC.1